MNVKKDVKKHTPFIIISLLIGALSFIWIYRNKAVKPDRILNEIKTKFRTEGPIEGSWIEMTKVPWSQSRNADKKEVYYGGLSRYEEGKLKHYEFIANAYSGNLIDLYEI